MEKHVISFVVLITVAVYTLTLFLVVHGNLVVEYLRLLKRRQITLSYLHIGPSHIRWFNQTIRQILVYRLFGHLDHKWVERKPFARFLSPHLYLQALTLRGIQHLVPFWLWNLHFHTVSVGLLLAIGSCNTCHTRCILVSRKHKVKRCDVAGYGYITIIGIDGGQTLCLFR